MKKMAIIPGLILALCSLLPAQHQDGEDVVIGTYRTFRSAVTNEQRTLLVWLPRSYAESSLRYPVLYVLYGQNTSAYLMPTITACDLLAVSGRLPEMIVVGVATAERYRDYSSIADGYIENTVKFFRDELFPFVDANYRTQSFRVVIGPQAGAVFSFYCLLQHPDLFHAFILENPFVWQNREPLLQMARERLGREKSLNRFLFIREEKGARPEFLQATEQFAEWMKSEAPAGFRFHYRLEEPSGYFVPPAPAKEGLQELFREFAFPKTLKVEGVEDVKRYYAAAGGKFGLELAAPEHVLTMEGDKLLAARRYDQVAGMLAYQLSLYPRSLNALMRMADLKRILGDYPEAVRWYDEFLKIRPTDAVAIRNRRNNIENYMKESLVYLLEKDIASRGINRAVRDFGKRKSSPANKLTCAEGDLNTLGYSLLGRGQTPAAVRVLCLAVELYPRSANLYDSLGEAYMTGGDVRNAIRSYEKSLQLNPGNENARRKLEELRR